MLMDTDSAFDESTSADDEGINTTQLLLVLCVIVILFLLVLLVVIYNSQSSSLADESIIEGELDFDENAKENPFEESTGKS